MYLIYWLTITLLIMLYLHCIILCRTVEVYLHGHYHRYICYKFTTYNPLILIYPSFIHIFLCGSPHSVVEQTLIILFIIEFLILFHMLFSSSIYPHVQDVSGLINFGQCLIALYIFLLLFDYPQGQIKKHKQMQYRVHYAIM